MLEELLTNKTKKKIIAIIFMLVMVVFMVYPVYHYTSVSRIRCDEINLDGEWKVRVHGKGYRNVTLSDFKFDMCNKGDTVSLECELPSDKLVDRPVLYFYTVHAAVAVYLDDVKIYSYGHNLYERGKLLGYGAHYVSLPDNYAKKRLRLEMIVTEDNAFDGIPMLKISQSYNVVKQTLSGMRLNLLVSMFLILFGIITMILSMFMLRRTQNFVQTYCIAMFSFLIGCWTLCNSDLIVFFISDLQVKAYMEYISFYMLPIPITYYFRNIVDEPFTPLGFRILFWLLLVVEVAYTSTVYICQFLNIAHFPQFLSGCHIIMALALMFVIGLNINQMKKKVRGHSSIMAGFAIAGLFVAIELVKYNLGKYIVGFSGNQYSSTLSFAVLILVIALLVDYGQSVSKNLLKDAKQRLLEHLAYVDELTGLYNRRKCEDTLLEYKEKGIPYAVISLDMNLLKKVNDTEGHDMGDAMLKKFADMLMEVYSLHGTVGRMGGDEFIVIMPDVGRSEAESIVSTMQENMAQKNIKDKKITLSTAYGLAMSDEVSSDEDAHAAYRLADSRMYENKKASKMGRRD